MDKWLIILMSIVLLSCSDGSLSKNNQMGSAQGKQSELVKKDSIQISTDLNLNTFSVIPIEIDGCACYFYLSKQDEQKGKYVFVNDFASIAFVSINGQMEKFDLKEHKENSNLYKYSNQHYGLTIEVTKKEDGAGETSAMEGVIKLSKGEKIIEKKFVGSCGC